MTQLSVFRSLIGLGTLAQVVGLVVLALAYPVIIVRARLLSLGNSYEEAGMDLGASPVRTLGRRNCEVPVYVGGPQRYPHGTSG